MIKYFNMASSICAKPYIDCMLKNQYYIHACIILYFLINLLINNNNIVSVRSQVALAPN